LAIATGMLSASRADPYYHDAAAKARGDAGNAAAQPVAPAYRQPMPGSVTNEAVSPQPSLPNGPMQRRSFSYEPAPMNSCPMAGPATTSAPAPTGGPRRYSYEPTMPVTTAPAYAAPTWRSPGRDSSGFYSRADAKALDH